MLLQLQLSMLQLSVNVAAVAEINDDAVAVVNFAAHFHQGWNKS